MSDVISLKKAERQVFLVATQDGLLDIFIGCVFLIWAIAPFLTPSLGDFWGTVVFVPFWGMVMLGIWLIRKHVVKPRVGVVRFGSARKTRLRKFTVVMLTVNIIALILGIWRSFNSEALSGGETSALFGLICLVLCSVAAYFLDFRRLYVYGLLVGLSPLIGEWLWVRGSASHHGFPITFGVTATLMILTGLFVFVRLLSNNPAPREEVTTGEA
ncbi:MAG TPA: hypothetical protein VMY05_00925 [Acidobacteriota bacterium]|nr:hypothetical protein [Acidobacteriota bacterium]